jgi:hypothetical protein
MRNTKPKKKLLVSKCIGTRKTKETHRKLRIRVPPARDHAAHCNGETTLARLDGVAQIVEVDGLLGAPPPRAKHGHHFRVLRERCCGFDKREELLDPYVAVVVAASQRSIAM